MTYWLNIVSGGQTGVDRAALDFAIENSVPCGGWCPKGRMAEDGVIGSGYPLQETKSADPAERTKKNVEESDGVLVFVDDKMDEGTGVAVDHAEELEKPLFVVYLKMNLSDQEEGFSQFMKDNQIKKINVVGPRESNSPGIYHKTRHFLNELFWKYSK